MRYLNRDSRAGELAFDNERSNNLFDQCFLILTVFQYSSGRTAEDALPSASQTMKYRQLMHPFLLKRWHPHLPASLTIALWSHLSHTRSSPTHSLRLLGPLRPLLYAFLLTASLAPKHRRPSLPLN